MNTKTNLQKVHRFSAIGIGVFTLAHIFNHVMAAHSIELHIEVMNALRLVYYYPIIEVLLVISILIQAFTGVQLFRKNRKHLHSRIAKLQAYSGLYLAFFLVAHSTATIGGNWFFQIDTNFYFGAMVVNIFPYVFFFAPYYFLAVTSFFTHIACTLSKYVAKNYDLKTAQRFVYASIAFGAITAIVILLAFSGMLYEFEFPDAYLNLYPS
ncbi:MAG: hypothetical protein ACPGVB_12835 [Chitinophagales bacterium]